jgi:C-terminal processing protease CtpA/Prc
VVLSLYRQGLTEALDVPIVRDSIKIQSVRSYLLPNHIGYVRVSEFIERTTEDFTKALDGLKKQGPLKGLVVDLRNDPGGLLNEAIGVADVFIEKGKILVSTKGRGARQTQEFKATDEEKFDKKPVVVLVNEGSASGSEIVAGALKDWKRGVLVGSKTFGKGSVQTILPLENSDGAALRLTMAKYYTPSGICIHGIGIDPDLETKAHDLTESTLRIYSKRWVEKFAKVLEKEGAEIPRGDSMGLKTMDRFYDYCMKNEKKIDRGELKKDAEFLGNSLYVEMVRLKKGEKEARETAVLRDPQVLIAEDIILNDGKISTQLLAKYPKKKEKETAGEKKLENEKAMKKDEGDSPSPDDSMDEQP